MLNAYIRVRGCVRSSLSEERNVLRIRAAEPFGECGGPERGRREGFRRHYRGHCPPEIIKLKSNYGLIIVNPPPIPKAFCTRNLDGIEGDVCDDGEDCWTNDEFLGMFGWIVRSEEFIDTRYNATRLRPLRGTKLFAVNVTFQLRWFRCLWQILKRIGEADFPPVHWGKWFRFLRILSGESFLFLERS